MVADRRSDKHVWRQTSHDPGHECAAVRATLGRSCQSIGRRARFLVRL